MNDWLNYKGSGSSRAYMGDTVQHAGRLPGVRGYVLTPTEEQEKKLSDAMFNYGWALVDKEKKLSKDKQDCINQKNQYEKKKTDLEAKRAKIEVSLKQLEERRRESAKGSPLRAYNSYESNIYQNKQNLFAVDKEINTLTAEISKIDKKISDIDSEIERVRREYESAFKEFAKYDDSYKESWSDKLKRKLSTK